METKKSHPQTAMHRPLTDVELNKIVSDSQKNRRKNDRQTKD